MGFEKHLLVDGSNILHAWPELRATLRRDRDAARVQLSQALQAIHDAEEVRVTIVFDGRGQELALERPSGHATFTHIYTPVGTTADDVIEQLVGQASDLALCYVATDDRAERQTIEALGAVGLSATDLTSWSGRANQRQQARVATLQRENERTWRQKES